MRIWQFLVEGYDPQTIVSAIVQEAGIEVSIAEADVKSFIASMVGQGILYSPIALDIDDDDGRGQT